MLLGFFYLTRIKIIEIFLLLNVIMRIVIIGYSGSGKSSLGRFLGEKYGIPMLHFDTVHFLPNWKVRAIKEKEKIVRDFWTKTKIGVLMEIIVRFFLMSGWKRLILL